MALIEHDDLTYYTTEEEGEPDPELADEELADDDAEYDSGLDDDEGEEGDDE